MWDLKIWRYATLSPERQAELKSSNWAQWCREASKARDRVDKPGKQCVDCGWPMDEFPENENNKENRFSPNRCLVCIAINSIVNASPYSRQLERDDTFRRKSMGLNGE